MVELIVLSQNGKKFPGFKLGWVVSVFVTSPPPVWVFCALPAFHSPQVHSFKTD